MTWLLALETSGKYGSVALRARNGSDRTLKCLDLPKTVGSAQSLASSISQLLTQSELRMSQISCVGLVTGPGSFTGLRVGVGTAKAIAYARKIPVVEADTLDVIRWQWEQLTTPCQIPYVHVVLDAYRGELFTKSFARGQVVSPTRTVGVGQFVVEMRSHDSRSDQHAVVGPGCERIDRFLTKENHDESLGEWVKGTCWFSGSETAPHASGVSHECLEKWLSGDILDPFSLAPRYFRGSAAEEKARKV